jgi:hypothetical protein
MNKITAIELLGGTVTAAAIAIGTTSSAISQWPDDLPPRLADRVLAACMRRGIKVPASVLQRNLRRERLGGADEGGAGK